MSVDDKMINELNLYISQHYSQHIKRDYKDIDEAPEFVFCQANYCSSCFSTTYTHIMAMQREKGFRHSCRRHKVTADSQKSGDVKKVVNS